MPDTRTASGLIVPGPASASAGAGSFASGSAPPSAEERTLERAYLDELEALKAGTGAGAKLPAAGSPAAPAIPANAAGMGLPPELLAALNPHAAGHASLARGAAIPVFGADEMAEQRGWARKSDSGRAQARTGSAGGGGPHPPRSPYLIRAGWTIPAILEQDLNSDLPGEIRALVTQNVYDTATGEYLLIPQGTRLIGTYDSAVAYGQGALQAVWTRLVFPDASILDLEAGRAQDASGRAGLRFRTTYHTGRLLGAALLTSLFSAGYEIAQGNQRGSILDGTSASDRAARGAAEEISRLGAEVARRNLNIAPTIEIPAGFRLQVFVVHDIMMLAPYGGR